MSAASETLPGSDVQPLHSRESQSLSVAVAGNPNTGKTSLFNVLTGLRQKVANYPGVTVETKMGQWRLTPVLAPARVIDLPGLYSLDATSLDEQIARDVLLGRALNMRQPDVVIVASACVYMSWRIYSRLRSLVSTTIDIKSPCASSCGKCGRSRDGCGTLEPDREV